MVSQEIHSSKLTSLLNTDKLLCCMFCPTYYDISVFCLNSYSYITGIGWILYASWSKMNIECQLLNFIILVFPLPLCLIVYLFEVVYWHTSGLKALTCRASMVNNWRVVTKLMTPTALWVDQNHLVLVHKCTVGQKTLQAFLSLMSLPTVVRFDTSISPSNLGA